MSVRVYLVVIYACLLVVYHVAFAHVKRCVRWGEYATYMDLVSYLSSDVGRRV